MGMIDDLKTMLGVQSEKLDNLASLTETLKNAESRSGDLAAELNAANAKNDALMSELADERAKSAELAATIENPNGHINRSASAKAAEIAANQGVPSIGIKSDLEAGAADVGSSLVSRYQMIDNPVDRVKFLRANKEKINQAALGR